MFTVVLWLITLCCVCVVWVECYWIALWCTCFFCCFVWHSSFGFVVFGVFWLFSFIGGFFVCVCCTDFFFKQVSSRCASFFGWWHSTQQLPFALFVFVVIVRLQIRFDVVVSEKIQQLLDDNHNWISCGLQCWSTFTCERALELWKKFKFCSECQRAYVQLVYQPHLVATIFQIGSQDHSVLACQENRMIQMFFFRLW